MRHTLLAGFELDYSALGPDAKFARTECGQSIIATILSSEAFSAVVGAVEAAPSRPPYPALDRYLLPAVGIAAADKASKTLTGRVVRQAVEHIGGEHTSTGKQITVSSVFAYGSTYRLGTTTRGKFNAEQRRAWAQRRLDNGM